VIHKKKLEEKKWMEKGVKKLGDILVDAELITEDQLKEALQLQKQNYKPLGELLLDLNYVTENQLYKALEYLFQVPYINLLETTPEKDALSLINENVAQKHTLIPVAATPKTITVVMKDPLNYEAIDDVGLLTGREVKIAISPPKDITNAIDRYYSNEGAKKSR
jgi:GSPII_E N-terminal domain.